MKSHFKSRRRSGFTLIEMVVVISMILILLAIAVPMYNHAIKQAKEARLHYNVMVLNKVIQEYSQNKRKAPLTPDDLVSAGYLKSIPDDITGKNDTWVWEQEDQEKAWDPNQPGIGSVHSGSNEISLEGTPYSSWVK